MTTIVIVSLVIAIGCYGVLFMCAVANIKSLSGE